MDKATEPDIQKYCDLMEEVKRRMAVIDFFLAGQGHAIYLPTTIESACLQLRKVLELVVFGSLIANKEAYSNAYSDFASHCHGGKLLKSLERVNPDFYPKPVIESPVEVPGVLHQLKDRNPDFLAKTDFEEVYGRCGVIMHSSNPFGHPINYDYYKENLPRWRTEILNLLNNHQIKLVGEIGFWLIHMKENQDDKVHFYKFSPASKPTS
jgi:hypothetical protein